MYKRYFEPSSSSLNEHPTKYIIKELKLNANSTVSNVGSESAKFMNDVDKCARTPTVGYQGGNEIEGRDEENFSISCESFDMNGENDDNNKGGNTVQSSDSIQNNGNEEDESEVEDYNDEVTDDEEDCSMENDIEDESSIEDANDWHGNEEESDEDYNEAINDDDFFDTVTDELIHPNLNCKIADAVLMILSFFLRHRLTWVALQDLLTLFDSILGNQCRLPKTKYLFKKIFSGNKESHAVFHFYCKYCNLYIDTYENLKAKNEKSDNDMNCPNCSSVFCLDKMNDGHFFIQLPIKQQIELKIIKNINILNYNTKADSDFITDIFDGDLYKCLREKIGNCKLVTLTMNTDGVRVFKSKRKSSLWPIQLFINEIDPVQRFALQNIILAGIWFGKDPDFHLYMKPFTDELKELNRNKIKINVNDKCLDISVRGLLMTTDTPARCKLLKMKQFNGTYGCTYCFHPGDNSSHSKYSVTPRYLYSLRTHKNTVTLMTEFMSTGKGSLGIQGVSPLLGITDFDLIRGTPIDYMHCVLLGVVSLLMDLWFDSTNHFEEFYITPRGRDVVNKNIEHIKPLRTFSRRPRQIDDKKFWKANEFRNWLLYFAIPCLKGVLKDKYFQHFALLSESIFILLKTNISANELKHAGSNIKKFVLDFQNLYGIANMMYNVHLLTHLVACVKNCGPLWTFSNFNFESNNGFIVSNVNGTTDVEHQILSKYFYNDVLNTLKVNSEKTCTYIEKIEKNRVRNRKKIGQITLLGKPKKQDLNSEEELILQRKTVLAYKKFFYMNDVFLSTANLTSRKRLKRLKQTNDTVVCLKDGSFGEITAIYESDNTVFILLKTILVEPDRCPKHLKQIVQHLGTYTSIRADEISQKCVLISTASESYLSTLPNRVESD